MDKISPTGLSAGVIVEGDLLFNMFWGSHVALAGIVDFTGLGTTSVVLARLLRWFLGRRMSDVPPASDGEKTGSTIECIGRSPSV